MLILAHLRSSPEVERRRVRLFLTSLLAGVLPLTLDVLLASLVPAYREYTRATHRIGAVGIGLSLALLIVPIATVYAVLVNRVFDVHFFVRKALQYALARYTLLGLLAVPAVGLASYAYANRDRSIGELLQVQPSVGWVLLIATGLTLVFLRRPLLELLDRQFFREEYDARRVLVALVDGSRRAGSVKEQAALTVREIDRALHVVTVVMLVRDRATNCFVDPQGNLQSLPCDAQLATLIGGAGTPLDATVASSALDRLSTADQDWLSHAHARLFVPVFSSSGSLLGIIAIGEKLSETPFSSEDRELLASVAAAAAMALEHRQLLDSGLSAGSDTPDESPDSDPARQCSSCGIVQQAASERCSRCGGALTAARLPAVLAGTFAIEREIGHGGMGVVYRGRDLKLDRAVALKTLPRVSVSSVNRLRQEALAMAALQDPHLAVIYGAENWRGSPVLILEYLAGGTLADRLRAGPLPVEEVVTLGLAISSALNTIHRSGLLHRDIKPSNIGYTAGGVPKLLDFGLARLVTGVSRILPAGASSTTAHTFSRGHTRETSEKKLMATATQHLAGTAAYLSPEAIAMEPPSASFDLWSLSVTLFEALTGKNPFLGADVQETFYLISFPRLPNWPMVGSNHPTPLISFFRGALSSRREERPASARAFHEALGRCLAGSRATENSTSAA
jgi:serine/threonine protein kinase